MRTWIENFKPRMVIWKENAGGACFVDVHAGDTVICQAVCADRVLRVRHKIAVKNANGDKTILGWLGGR